MRPEHWLFTIPLRLRSLFRWTQTDQELDDELRDHIERKTEEYIAKGMTQEEAQRRARLDLDGVEKVKEKCRDARRVNWIQDLIQDIRYGLRILRKSPGFTSAAVLTIALGIGANAAIFGLLDSAFLRGLPYHQPERLVHIWTIEADHDWYTPTPAQYQAVREQEIFAPLVLGSYARQGNVRAGKMRVQIIARLRPGVILRQARSEAEVIASQFRNPSAGADRTERFVVEDFGDMFRNPGPTVQNANRGLWMTAVASGVVLLIACANVASLLRARSVKRHRDVAVRSALGCTSKRMIRQLLTESSLLFLCGGIIAVIITRWGEEIVTKTASEMLPGVYLHVDVRVFLVSLAVSLLSALAFGMIPA